MFTLIASTTIIIGLAIAVQIRLRTLDSIAVLLDNPTDDFVLRYRT